MFSHILSRTPYPTDMVHWWSCAARTIHALSDDLALFAQIMVSDYFIPRLTPNRRQSKTLLTIDERGSKIARNGVFGCHLSSIGQQMTIENSVSNDFWSTFVDRINAFDCRLSRVSPDTYDVWMYPSLSYYYLLDSLRPSQHFSVMSGQVFLGWTSTKRWYMCLAQGPNTLTPVRLEPADPRSRVKHLSPSTSVNRLYCKYPKPVYYGHFLGC